MKKLNNKGYLIVEIIISVTLAMAIAYFLIDLTIKLKDRYEDTYVDTLLMTDKTIITNEILGDLYTMNITDVTTIGDCKEKLADGCGLVFTLEDETNKLGVIYSEVNENKYIKYGTGSLNESNKFSFTADTDPIYSKKLSDKLILSGTGSVTVVNNIASFIIPLETLYSKKDYGINIIIPYTYSET